MEILLLTEKYMRAEDGKQEIFLEWPKLIVHLIPPMPLPYWSYSEPFLVVFKPYVAQATYY